MKRKNRKYIIYIIVCIFIAGVISFQKITFYKEELLRFSFSFIIYACFAFLSLARNRIVFSKYSVAFSIVSSLVMVTGIGFTSFGTLFFDLSLKRICLLLFKFIAYIPFFICVYSFFSSFLNRLKQSCINNDLLEGLAEEDKKNRFPIYFFLSFVVYGLWLILLRPNIATYDSANQISQALGWIPLQNNNPFLHTLLMRCVLKPAFALTGSVVHSILVYEIFSILVFSLITAKANAFIDRCFPYNWSLPVITLKGFFFINPLVGWYSVTLWKDIWISYFLLLFVVLLFENYLFKNRSLVDYLWISLVSTAVLFCKGTGIISICFLVFAVIITLRNEHEVLQKKNGLKIILSLLISIAIYGSVTFIATNCFHVEKHSEVDTESLIWQTTARTLKYHLDEMDAEEINDINSFIDVEKASNAYNPQIADPIKSAVQLDYFNTHRAECLRTWLSLGLKYPETYIDALYASGYGYLFPDIRYWVFSSDNYVMTIHNYTYQSLLNDPFFDTYDMQYAEKRQAEVSHYKAFLSRLRAIPLIGLYASIGAYFLLYFMLMFLGIENRINHVIVLIVIPFSVYISCIFSPVYAEMRYAYPAILSLPVFIAAQATSMPKLISKRNQ